MSLLTFRPFEAQQSLNPYQTQPPSSMNDGGSPNNARQLEVSSSKGFYARLAGVALLAGAGAAASPLVVGASVLGGVYGIYWGSRQIVSQREINSKLERFEDTLNNLFKNKREALQYVFTTEYLKHHKFLNEKDAKKVSAKCIAIINEAIDLLLSESKGQLFKRINESEDKRVRILNEMDGVTYTINLQRSFKSVYEKLIGDEIKVVVEEKFNPEIEFYSKWSKRQELSFDQRDLDPKFVQKGMCMAIATRWALKDFDNPNNDKVYPERFEAIQEDRDFQDMHESTTNAFDEYLRNQGKNIEDLSHAEKSAQKANFCVSCFPKEMLKGHSITFLGEANILIADKVADNAALFQGFWKDLQGNLEKALHQKTTPGVFILFFSLKDAWHQVYLRFDQTKDIFRLGDPLYGIYKLQNKDELSYLLKDLFFIYEKVDGYKLFQIGLGNETPTTRLLPEEKISQPTKMCNIL